MTDRELKEKEWKEEAKRVARLSLEVFYTGMCALISKMKAEGCTQEEIEKFADSFPTTVIAEIEDED